MLDDRLEHYTFQHFIYLKFSYPRHGICIARVFTSLTCWMFWDHCDINTVHEISIFLPLSILDAVRNGTSYGTGSIMIGPESEVPYLEDGEHSLVERVEVVARCHNGVVITKLRSEQLLAEQSEDDDEEKQQQQQAGDWTQTVDERRHQISKRAPVPTVSSTNLFWLMDSNSNLRKMHRPNYSLL